VTEESIFAAAVVIPDPAARAAYLDRACAGNVELRKQLDALVAAHFAADPRFDPATVSAAEFAATRDPDGTRSRPAAAETEGTVIAGRYKLRQQIGEGGMGTVWMADQTEPVKRKVAVKLIRVERGQSKAILARFEAERQAIALMDHPHIAKLLDAGTTDTGSPFFVMELVKGIPLTDFCDQHKLTIPERLALFTQICSAVQHAHQKGVIHRDLKPGNILVESHDGRPVPKVIDFGLAKATTGIQLSEQSMFTAFGSVMGTPAYMAPEQAAFNAVDIDTRADVYALGVVLYELLTGTTPLTREAIKQAQLDEMLRLIREQEAPTPSSRLSSSEAKPTVAANRQTEPARLGRFVKGELDWIVLKALAKERDHRYETATGFAKDIERFLNHEPVTAGPPSASYRLRKFVRRNRPQVLAASLVLVALLAGIAGTTWGLLEARRQEGVARRAADEERDAKQREAERAAAEQRAKEEAEGKRVEAERNLSFATASNEILEAVIDGLDPKMNYATTGDLTKALRANLATAVKRLDAAAIGDPLVVARMRNRLGLSLLALGDFDQALTLFAKALVTHQVELGPDHTHTLATMANMVVGYQAAGRPQLALRVSEEAFHLAEAKHGPRDSGTLSLASTLATCYVKAGNPELAMPIAEGAYRQLKDQLGPDHHYTLGALGALASSYVAVGKPQLALPLFEEAVRLMKTKYGPDHPETLSSMTGLAGCNWFLRRLDRSVPLYEEVLTLQVKKLGRSHPDTLATVANLGVNYKDAGRVAEAIPLLEEAYAASKKLPTLRFAGQQLLDAYAKAAKPVEAAKLIGELLADARRTLPKDSPQLAGLLAQSGRVLLQMTGFAEAEPLLREVLALRERMEPDGWGAFNARSMLGWALLGQKKYADAEPLLVQGYDGMKAREKTIPPQGASRIPEALDRLIELYTATNKPDEAKKYRELRAKYPTPKEVLPPPRKE
jgi:serine/threonine protein kinase